MFLFVFEFLGTSELMLIGVLALILLGPRQLPQIARKAGKIMSEFRGTASEFKQTWEREVNFEEEVKSLSLASLDEDSVAADAPASAETTTTLRQPPVVRTADPDQFRHLVQPSDGDEPVPSETRPEPARTIDANDKQNWL